MFDIVTNRLSGFEFSLMHMPYKASQHSYGVFLVARGFQMQAVRLRQSSSVQTPAIRV
jgi:hypothetical protein